MKDSKSLADYNEGDEYRGEKITKLFAAKSDYLVFESDNSGEITIATESQSRRENCSKISPKITIISEYLITKREKKKFVDLIGLAYSEAIEGNLDDANKICNHLLQRIEMYKENVGRFYYLLSCFGVVCIAIIFAYLLKKFSFIPEIIPHYFYMTYASIGGFLSVAKNIKKIKIESTEFGWFQIVYGAIRIIIAMFSGLIMYLLIKSEILLSNFNDNYFIISIFSILSGFSESLIPNLLQKLNYDSKTGK